MSCSLDRKATDGSKIPERKKKEKCTIYIFLKEVPTLPFYAHTFDQLALTMRMTLKAISLLLFLVLIKQAAGEDTQSLMMSLFDSCVFQCAQTTCLPFSNVTVTDVRQCQFACLKQARCKAATYYQQTSYCQLYDNTVTQNESMSYSMHTVTMMAIPGTRLPSGQ